MAIRNISQIFCSLNLGLIYSVDYQYSPDSGSSITLFFVNQNGLYSRPQYMQKAQIRIGQAAFSMYVVASDLQLSQGRRVMSVEFVDETFMLDNYWVTLTGKGCGYNVFELGTPVDSRTPEQKVADAIDPDAQQLIDLTEFPDVEYSFDDFLTILRRKFAVQVNAFYDADLTNAYAGTFRDVLDSWCSLFNLSWYIENSVIKVFDPTKLTITLPSQPTDAIEYSSLEDVRSTYGKTCFNWFQQPGGQFSLNQTSNTDGGLLVRTDTLYPVNNIFNLPQPAIDLNQVAAAQYGEQFWFLYNYYKGTAAEQCGWLPIDPGPSSPDQITTKQSVVALGGQMVLQNNEIFQSRFDAYYEYGQSIAGRWYLSNEKSDIAIDQQFTWFDESQGQIFDFTNVDGKNMNLSFLTPVATSTQKIPETIINSFYPGVNYVGNRISYNDTTPISGNFSLGTAQVGLVYDSIFEIPGSESFNFAPFSSLATGGYSVIAYNTNASVPQDIATLINNIPSKTSVFNPRYSSIPIKGIKSIDYSTLKSSQTEQDGIDIVNDDSGGTVTSNTAVIKTLKQGAYTVYYDKYALCASAYSTGPYFGHKFEPRQISADNQIGVSFSKPSPNVYQLNRDYGVIQSLVRNPNLAQMAQPRSFPTRKVTFSVNYFYDVPVNFLTNGLVGLNVSIGDNGVTASYSYSNEVLQVPYPEKEFSRFEQMIRNSWIRQYTPNQVIS